jgi:HD-GYP domain-containing protein (c-di-GMP phosphodiesterase class II)
MNTPVAQYTLETSPVGSSNASVWRSLSRRLEPLLVAPTQHADFVPALTDCAAELVSAVCADSDWAIFQLVRPNPEKLTLYGVLHPLHTGVLMCLIGRRKDWHERRIATGVRAALTMNISITALQTELAHQSDALNDHQRCVINDHPLASARCLRELGVTEAEWLTAVEQHHEQPSGLGYPQGLTEVSILADALRTCDIFGAKMSSRVGRKGMLSPRAAAEIFRQRSAGYYGATIIGVLGLYPPGCLLRLSTGEAAVVLRRGTEPKCPCVAVLTDAHGVPLSEPQLSMTGPAHGRGVVGALVDTHLAGTVNVDRFF